ncbi:MAG: hypothetical protein ACYTGB_10580, partial [Planctomycetota bacterium]
SGRKVILGRNQEENSLLARLRRDEEMLLEPQGLPGPSALCSAEAGEHDMKLAAGMIAAYTEGGREVDVSAAVEAVPAGGARFMCRAQPIDRELIAGWRIAAAPRRRRRRAREKAK